MSGITDRPTRRALLGGGAGALGAALVGLQWPTILAVANTAAARHAESAPWRHLSTEEAAVLGAMADRIFPPDDTPGAQDLGVLHFMDGALGGLMAGVLPMVRSGCADLDRRAAADGARFAESPADVQDRLLHEIEQGPFFATVHFLTLCGVFADPVHGGNRGLEGWRMIGFEARHHWQPPFGHYDAGQSGEQDP